MFENHFYFFGNWFLNLFFVIFVKKSTHKLPNVRQN